MAFTFNQTGNTTFNFSSSSSSPPDPNDSFKKFYPSNEPVVYDPWSVNEEDEITGYQPVTLKPLKGMQDLFRPAFISHTSMGLDYLQPETTQDKSSRIENWLECSVKEPMVNPASKMPPPSSSTTLKRKKLIPRRRMDPIQVAHPYQDELGNKSPNLSDEEDPVPVWSPACNGNDWWQQFRKNVGVKRARYSDDQSCGENSEDVGRNAVYHLGMEDGEIESTVNEDQDVDSPLNVNATCRSDTLKSPGSEYAESEYEVHRNHRIRLAPPREENEDFSLETKRQARMVRFQQDLSRLNARNPTGRLVLTSNAEVSQQEFGKGWNQRTVEMDRITIPSFSPSFPISNNHLKIQGNVSTATPPVRGRRRPIVIDGCNVAYGITFGKYFDSNGIRVCVDHFLKNGFKDITVVVPDHRLRKGGCNNPEPLRQLKQENKLITCWSRKLPNGRWVTSYDDRMIVEIAHKRGAIIISNDRFRDLIKENPEWKETIGHRVLGFRFMPGKTDEILFPTDPFGRFGPNLEQLLHF